MTPHDQKQPGLVAADSAATNIFFSVVIPLYNKERHIRRAVDSVLQQSYGCFELIVVNDGSTDGSLQALNPVLPDITLINQDNGGESAARNAGINSANYGYIAFLDADDEWDEDFLQTILEMVSLKPGYHVYGTNYLIKNTNNSVVALSNPGNAISEIDYFELIRNGRTPVCASSICITAELFKEMGGFPQDVALYPDLYFWTKIAILHKFVFCSKPMAIYHRDADNRVCNLVVPTNKDTPFERLIDQAETEGTLTATRLAYAREYVCRYKLLNAFKSVTQKQSSQARGILRNTRPVTLQQIMRKYFIFALTILPESALHSVWLKLRRR